MEWLDTILGRIAADASISDLLSLVVLFGLARGVVWITAKYGKVSDQLIETTTETTRATDAHTAAIAAAAAEHAKGLASVTAELAAVRQEVSALKASAHKGQT